MSKGLNIMDWLLRHDRALLVGALLASVFFNLNTSWLLRTNTNTSDKGYSYVGDDYPDELPLWLDTVAMTVENSAHYNVSSREAYAEWHSLDTFSKAQGFVRLGPNERPFAIAMYHQIHCLNTIRESILRVHGYPDDHTSHCMNLLRQTILCAADTTLDPLDRTDSDGNVVGADGIGVTHRCRDWTQVYDFVERNQQGWTKGTKEAPVPSHMHGGS